MPYLLDHIFHRPFNAIRIGGESSLPRGGRWLSWRLRRGAQSILFRIDCYRRCHAGRSDSADGTWQFRSIVIHALPRPIFILFLFSLALSLFLSFCLPFLSFFSTSPAVFSRFFPSTLFLLAVRGRLCILSLPFSYPPLSFCLSCMCTCDGATTTMDEKGLVLYDRSDLFDCIEAPEESRAVPYRRNDFPPSRAIWGAVLTHRFTPALARAQPTAPGPIGRPIGARRFPVHS